MPRKSKKSLIICWKCIKIMINPFKRLKKYRKNNMKQFKITVSVVAIVSCFVTLLLYYRHRFSLVHKEVRTVASKKVGGTTTQAPLAIGAQHATPMRHVPLDEVYKNRPAHDYSFEMEELIRASVISTPGCIIPGEILPFQEYLKKENLKKPGTCGKRAVYLKKINGIQVKAVIKEKYIKTYLRKSARYECCYRFIMRSTRPGHENTKIEYTPCRKFKDGKIITLETDFVNVKCFELKKNTSRIVYDDVYAFTKMINETGNNGKTCRHQYNVLMLGMDSMSFPRLIQVMPRTIRFFRENYWFAFRGFHKIGDNTLPNLMAALTGKNMSSFANECSGQMNKCKDDFIWNKFKENGYVTAYGEDYLRLPDTFHDKFEFKEPPTDHYMRPLFMKGETEMYNKSLVCAGKAASAQHILDYAYDFALTYRSKHFFGLFWINSFSHNTNSRPQDADVLIENFFNRLTYLNVLDNTFIIFFSDHGLRFGEHRMPVESYYDERLPFFTMLSPMYFNGKHSEGFTSATENQYRLSTPYDMYNTLVDIHRLSQCKEVNTSEVVREAEACPKCHSLFSTISENRTCSDAAIHPKWCSCHKLFALNSDDTEAQKSIELMVTHIKSMASRAKPKRCWGCMSLTLKKIIRVHFYYDINKVKLYHVIAISMTPGNVSYEATVVRSGDDAELVGSVSVISPYRGLGQCTTQSRDRLFCVCQRMQKCPKKS